MGGSPGGTAPQAPGKSAAEGKGQTEKGAPRADAPSPALPKTVRDAERVARELLDRVERDRLTPAQLERFGLSVNDVRAFLKQVERIRAAMASSRAGDSSSTPPTFADFIEELSKSVKAGQKGDPAPGAASSGQGKGALRGVLDAIKETVDFEYQDVLEEYYRSLADPNWRRRK